MAAALLTRRLISSARAVMLWERLAYAIGVILSEATAVARLLQISYAKVDTVQTAGHTPYCPPELESS